MPFVDCDSILSCCSTLKLGALKTANSDARDTGELACHLHQAKQDLAMQFADSEDLQVDWHSVADPRFDNFHENKLPWAPGCSVNYEDRARAHD